jgi:hypothetical protein
MTTDIDDKQIIKAKRIFDDKPQSTDISTTVRLPLELRENIAAYCKRNRMTMNTFLLIASQDLLKK